VRLIASKAAAVMAMRTMFDQADIMTDVQPAKARLDKCLAAAR
jgi:hypothetical protein